MPWAYALSAFSAEQRTKEIGIRKVLGSTSGKITAMLTREFIVLIMISITIAIPVAYYVMNKWLEGFAYRHDLTITVFLYSAVIASGIGALTVGVQSIRAAIANPINSLRNE